MKLFLAPHNDDETLFGAFTILREKPVVAIVTDSFVQANRGLPITPLQRRQETMAAMDILGAEVRFCGFPDNDLHAGTLERFLGMYGQPEMVFAPAWEEGGHPHHNLVCECARHCFRNVTYYMTYTTRGKSTGVPVPSDKEWPLLKVQALSCYESQIRERSTVDHFIRAMRDQSEYQA